MVRQFIIVCLLLASLGSQAQTQTDSTAPLKLHVNMGLIANSALNYYGRTDSLKSKALCPFVGLSLTNGLYITGTAVFIDNVLQSEYAATLIEGGYNFHNKKNSWSGNIALTKYFYRPGTDLIQSAIKGMAAASITNSNKIVNITIAARAMYSDQVDIAAQAGLDHIVRLTPRGKKVVVLLDPVANVYAGTQHFTSTWYQQKNFLLLPTSQQAITQNSSRFNILAYEGGLPVVVAWKNFAWVIALSYIVPRNAEGAPGLFYCPATVRYSL